MLATERLQGFSFIEVATLLVSKVKDQEENMLVQRYSQYFSSIIWLYEQIQIRSGLSVFVESFGGRVSDLRHCLLVSTG
jgi:hypothetical protein